MDGPLRLPQLAILLLIYLLIAAVLPAVDDEVYYWCWSKELQWSYYDHPPMTAVLIRLSTMVFGDSVLGYRVPACLASTFVVYVISRLTPVGPIVLGAMSCLLFTLGAVLMTPDSPLVMFWAAYIWWLVALHQRLTPEHQAVDQTLIESRAEPHRQITMSMWIVGGMLLGCGVLSKYTMGLAVPASFVSFLLARRPVKQWIGGYIFHGVVSFIVASPILIYNLNQNFEPLLYQWSHAAEKTSNWLQSVGDFVGVQVLIFGTMPIALLPWVLMNARRLSQNPRLRVCWCFYALPILFFLYKSTQTRLQGNWALVCFVSFWPLAGQWYLSIRNSMLWKRLTAASFLPPVVAGIIAFVHLVWPIPLLPVAVDRIHRQIAMNTATKQIAEEIRKQPEPLPIYCDSYQTTSLLRFQSLNAQQIDGLTRPSHFTRPPKHLTDVQKAYVVRQMPLPEDFCQGFQPPSKLASVPILIRGTEAGSLNLWLYSTETSGDR